VFNKEKEKVTMREMLICYINKTHRVIGGVVHTVAYLAHISSPRQHSNIIVNTREYYNVKLLLYFNDQVHL
jgi:hypothetical protein